MSEKPRAFMHTPCENCPYRVDAPRQHWHRKEFERVLETDASTMGTTFACHKQGELPAKERGWCAGWALDQKRRRTPSIQMRLLLMSDVNACLAFEKLHDGGHELFKSVTEMCRANGVTRPRRRKPREQSIHSARVRDRQRQGS